MHLFDFLEGRVGVGVVEGVDVRMGRVGKGRVGVVGG